LKHIIIIKKVIRFDTSTFVGFHYISYSICLIYGYGTY